MSNEPNVEGSAEAPASKDACVNLDVDGKDLSFTHSEATTGKILYFILVISLTIVVLGAVWTILDLIMPTGKWDAFLLLFQTSPGVPLVMIGAGFLGLLMLIIAFYMLYKGGTHTITKALFSAKKVYRELKATTFVKFISGAIMCSIFVVAAGVVVYLIQLAMSTGGAPVELTNLLDTTGKQVLFSGILAVSFTLMAIAFMYLWNAGNILLTRKFFAPPKKVTK